MKGSELKNKKIKIELKDGVHEVVFDMNALCELEEIYGDIQVAMNSFSQQPVKALRSFVYAILKSEREDITIQEAGALIDMTKLDALMESFGTAIEEAMPGAKEETDEVDGEENPNV